jgi:YVTN family beta-propeller protein
VIDPTGSRFYVTGPGDGAVGDRQLEVYELDGNVPAGTLGLSEVAVGGMALAPDGGRLYAGTWVSSPGSDATGSLAVVDLAGPNLTATVPLSSPGGPVAVAPGGDRVYVGVRDGVEVVDPVAGRSLGVVQLGGSAKAIAVTADGRVLSAGPSGVKVIDPASNAVVSSIALRDNPAGIAVTPDGRRAVVSTSLSDAVAYIDLTTMTVTGGVRVGPGPETVVVTPDGQQALVANLDGGSLSVIDLATDAVTELNVGSFPEAIAVSPDGLVGMVVTTSNVVRFERVAS